LDLRAALHSRWRGRFGVALFTDVGLAFMKSCNHLLSMRFYTRFPHREKIVEKLNEKRDPARNRQAGRKRGLKWPE
jgi:hypothetical protein